jgi:2-keto-3-deoxy-L-rhamnonate aldolase RhmA
MRPGSLKDRVQDGATALGAWISLREPLLAETAGLAGYDYVVIDMQHGLSDYGEVVPMVRRSAGRRRCRSCACRGTRPGSSAGCSTPVPSA